ncbi:MAG: hypothetical protein IJS00_05820 [Paludibacteraceae bacterium]|nr:hypothetical protein [Paludibacteraceae bacterium]
MKRSLFLLMALLVAMLAKAVDYPYLVFTNTSGTNTVLSVSDMTLTVSGSELRVTNAEGTISFVLTELASMQFSKDGTLLALKEVLDADKPVQLFTLTGQSVGIYDNLKDAVQRNNAGVYVIKQGTKSQQIVIK